MWCLRWSRAFVVSADGDEMPLKFQCSCFFACREIERTFFFSKERRSRKSCGWHAFTTGILCARAIWWCAVLFQKHTKSEDFSRKNWREKYLKTFCVDSSVEACLFNNNNSWMSVSVHVLFVSSRYNFTTRSSSSSISFVWLSILFLFEGGGNDDFLWRNPFLSISLLGGRLQRCPLFLTVRQIKQRLFVTWSCRRRRRRFLL